MDKELNISRQAKAFFELYRSMPKKVQKKLKKMILEQDVEYQTSEHTNFSKISEPSLKDIWDTPENDHWDDFLDNKDD